VSFWLILSHAIFDFFLLMINLLRKCLQRGPILVNQAEKLLTILHFNVDSYVCHRLSIDGVLHDANSFDVQISNLWNNEMPPILKNTQPTGYCGDYHIDLYVSDDNTHEPVNQWIGSCLRQVLQFSRPDQKLIIDRCSDSFHRYNSLTWKSIDYSLVKGHGDDKLDKILLKIEKEDDVDLLVELQANSEHGWSRSKLAHLPVADSSTFDTKRITSARLLGNEMYVVVLKTGRLNILYFDPNVKIKPDHIRFC
jgi:hypothetical protein